MESELNNANLLDEYANSLNSVLNDLGDVLDLLSESDTAKVADCKKDVTNLINNIKEKVKYLHGDATAIRDRVSMIRQREEEERRRKELEELQKQVEEKARADAKLRDQMKLVDEQINREVNSNGSH